MTSKSLIIALVTWKLAPGLKVVPSASISFVLNVDIVVGLISLLLLLILLLLLPLPLLLLSSS